MAPTGAGTGKRPTLEDVAARHGHVPLAGVTRHARSVPARPRRPASGYAAAAEIGYRPDARARLLAQRPDPRLIGVVFGMTGRFHLELLDGLYVAAGRPTSQLILSRADPAP